MIRDIEEFLRENWILWFEEASPPRWIRILKTASSLSERSYVMLFVFLEGESAPSVVVRIPRTHRAQQRMAEQHENIQELRGQLPSSLISTLPRPIGLFELDRRLVWIEHAVPGRPMASIVASSRRWIRMEFKLALTWLLQFHRVTMVGPEPFDDRMLQHTVKDIIQYAERLNSFRDTEKEFIQGVAAKAHECLGLLVPHGWVHGDYWPRNILSNGEQFYVTDWENCDNDSLPFLDLFLFPLGYGLALGHRKRMSPLAAFDWSFFQPGIVLEEGTRFIVSYFREMGIDPRFLDVFWPITLLQLAIRQTDPLSLSPELRSPAFDRFCYLANNKERFLMRL